LRRRQRLQRVERLRAAPGRRHRGALVFDRGSDPPRFRARTGRRGSALAHSLHHRYAAPVIARGIRIFLVAVLLAAVLAVAAAAALAGWVLHTPSGTAWAFERLRAAIPGELAS